MSKTRTKKQAPTEPEKTKGKHGGARKGAGRPRSTPSVLTQGIYTRCTPEQKAALTAHVSELSEKLGSKIDLSTWLRELALKHSGNGHLGAAAAAQAAADKAAAAADILG